MDGPRIPRNHWRAVTPARSLVAMALVAVLLGCSRNARYQRLEDVFPIEERFTIVSDSIGEIYDVATIGDSLLLFSDLSSRSLYVYAPRAKRLTKVGSNGTGPGQYLLPAELEYRDGRVFFKELTQPVVKVMDLHGNPLGEVGGGKPFLVSFAVSEQGHVLALSRYGPAVWEIATDGRVLCTSQRQAPKNYQFLLGAMHGGGICVDDSGFVYYAHAAPYIIHKLDRALREVKAFDGTHLPHYRSFARELLGGRHASLGAARRRELMKQGTTVLGLWCDGADVLIVKLSDVTRKNRCFVDLWTTRGEYLGTVRVPEKYFAGASEGRFVLVSVASTLSQAASITIELLRPRPTSLKKLHSHS